MTEIRVPERTRHVYSGDSGLYHESYDDRETNNFWNGRPKGTVVVRNYMDGTGVHYYDAAGKELKR